MVSFNLIPNGLLEPFVAVEFDSSKAESGPQIQPFAVLFVAQRLTTGTVPLIAGSTVTAPQLITNKEQAAASFGAGSVAYRMAAAALAANRVTPLWIVGVADDGAGAAATYTVTIAVTTAIAGTIYLYIAGELVSVGVIVGDTPTTIGARMAAAVNAAFGLPVTATASVGVVTLLARNKGTNGNSIDVRTNYRRGELTPGGVTVTVAAGVAGATDPSTFADVWAAIGETWYNRFAFGWRNTALMTAVDAELESRFGPMRAIDGVAFWSIRDTHANAVTLGASLNSKHHVVIGRYRPASSEFEYAASMASVTALAAQQDPARPHQTLELVGLHGPDPLDDFDYFERNILLGSGIATVYSDAGIERIGRTVTTYKTNASGAVDTSYRDLKTRDCDAYVRYSLRNLLLVKFPRSKLANDETRFGAGQAIVTPLSMRGELLAWYRELEVQGIVEDFDGFNRDLVVERNATDPDRLDMLVPTNFINGLIIRAVQIQFRL